MQVYSASANEFIWASVHSRDGEGLMMSYGDRMRWLRLADEGTHRVIRRFVGVGQHVQVERHFQYAACLSYKSASRVHVILHNVMSRTSTYDDIVVVICLRLALETPRG